MRKCSGGTAHAHLRGSTAARTTSLRDLITSQHGASVNIRNHRGDSPLHEAVKWKHVATVRLLIERDAMVYYKNSAGRTPLDMSEQVWERSACTSLLAASFVRSCRVGWMTLRDRNDRVLSSSSKLDSLTRWWLSHRRKVCDDSNPVLLNFLWPVDNRFQKNIQTLLTPHEQLVKTGSCYMVQ